MISLNVNGMTRNVDVLPNETLAMTLRYKLGLTGTKLGCDRGECGACTVLVDGVNLYACSLLTHTARNKQIITIEGLESSDGMLHPVQQAMIDELGPQCGFCTPGQIMSAVALLSNNPNPTRDEVRRALSGNLCRCGAYDHYINAVMLAAERGIVMAKDMMPAFELYQPDSLDNALELLSRFGDQSWIVAGGHDSFDWFKDRTKYAQYVIDLNNVNELKGITETSEGIEIGAMTSLTEIELNDVIRQRYSLLSDAVSRVASPQIRHIGTIGGNLNQDARCWYYRYGVDCYRAGGNSCYADTPEGQNREHCLWGASRCVAVSPSDVAPAMVVLEATMVIASANGLREVPAEDYFIGPNIDIERMTVIEPGEVLVSIKIPNTWANAMFYFEKVADRNTWDFPLVNISRAMFMENGVVSRIRMAAGAVECIPRRLSVVEQVVTGSEINDETAELASQAATRGATPLNFNHFKIPLLQNLVKRALRA